MAAPTIDVEHLAARLPEAASRVRQWVLDASEEDMGLILKALEVQVTASREKIQIEGTVPVAVHEGDDLVTTGQTLA